MVLVLDGRVGCVFLVLDGINKSQRAAGSYVAGFCVTAFHLCPVKEKCGETQRNAFCRPALAPVMATARPRYSGLSRKLIVSIDIGTTFSGAAYALLDPGQVPQIRPVTRRVLPPSLIR